MSKGLEALKDLAMLEWLCSQKGMLFDWERIRKPLKALEIIKKLLIIDDDKQRIDVKNCVEMSDDEYDLLKEVLL